MAKFLQYKEEQQAAAGDFVKADDLFQYRVVFSMSDARVVTTPFRDEQNGDLKQGIEFKIHFTDRKGVHWDKTLTLAANPARMWFVEYFIRGGETLEDMILIKLPSTGKGNPPYGFESADTLPAPKRNERTDVPF